MNENLKLLKYSFRFAIVYIVCFTMIFYIGDASAVYFDYDYEIITKIGIFITVITLLLIFFAVFIAVSKFIQDYKRVPNKLEKIKLSILSSISMEFAPLQEKYLYPGNIGTIFELPSYSGLPISWVVAIISLQFLFQIAFFLLIYFVYGLISKIMFKKYNKNLQ